LNDGDDDGPLDGVNPEILRWWAYQHFPFSLHVVNSSPVMFPSLGSRPRSPIEAWLLLVTVGSFFFFLSFSLIKARA